MRIRLHRVALAGLALLLTACGSSGTPSEAGRGEVGTQGDDVPNAFSDGTRSGCPASGTRIRATPGLTTLPGGATAALLCRQDNGRLWFPPAGTLTRGLPALVHLVDSRHASQQDPDQVCDADLGLAYAIVLRYPDGVRTITARTDGCRQIDVGSTVRPGARPLLDAYLHALTRQRAHTSPPARRPRIDACITPRIPPLTLDSERGRLSDALLCARHGSRFVRHGRRLDAAQLGALRHDFATARQRVFKPRPGQHYCRAPIIKGPVRVSAVDRWGDRLVVDLGCDIYPFERATPEGSLVHLLPRTARLLARR
jgi:hypothetical protein